jgi:hypothetical protein
MPEGLRQIAAATSENIRIATEGIASETFLNMKRESLHTAPYVRAVASAPPALSSWVAPVRFCHYINL